jgi:hypothetical protein
MRASFEGRDGELLNDLDAATCPMHGTRNTGTERLDDEEPIAKTLRRHCPREMSVMAEEMKSD